MASKSPNIYIHYNDYQDVRIDSIVRQLQNKLNQNGLGSHTTPRYWEGDTEQDWKTRLNQAVSGSDVVILLITRPYATILNNGGAETTENIFARANQANKKLFTLIVAPINWAKANWLKYFTRLPNTKSWIELDHLQQNELTQALISHIKFGTSILTERTPVEITKDTVFISYASKNFDYANEVGKQLEGQEIDFWMDKKDLVVGQDWKQEIDKGIEQCLAIILIMTPLAKASEYVTYEWAYALGKGRPVFPLIFQEAGIHPRLENLQYLDFCNIANRPWGKLFEAIKYEKNHKKMS